MEIRVSELNGTAVISMQDGFKLGECGEVVINPDDGKLMGILTKKGFFQKSLAIGLSDIRQVSAEGIIVESAESLSEIEELVRIKNFLDKGYKLIGARVVTEKGQGLGKLADYSIETDLGMLEKIFVKSVLKRIVRGELEITEENIVRIEPKTVIVKDATIKEEAAQPVTTLAAQ